MIPTLIGAAVALVGLLLLMRGSVAAMMAMLIICTLMPGSAAIALPALGGSTIPPVQFALLFVLVRLFVGEPRFDILREAIVLNLALLAYVAYGVVIAMIGPKMFSGEMYVVPMHLEHSGAGLRTVALGSTPQNITSSVYLVGTLMISIFTGAMVLHAGGLKRFVTTIVVAAWIMAFLGVTGAVFAGTVWTDVLDFFRNGNYAQTEQTFASLSRIKGISPEPSTYATSGMFWFVFLAECWTRDVKPRSTGLAAAALGLVLLFSTSSTAYLGLAAYGTVYALRTIMIPKATPFRKIAVIGAAGFLGVIAVAVTFVLVPSFAALFIDMVSAMTVGKSSSESAIERASFAAQGIEAFRLSNGLGVGPGSFRSSSIAMAVLGTTGVIGAVSLCVHLLRVFKPLRPSTYLPSGDGLVAVGVSAAWAAMIGLIPAIFTSPSGDPGPEFAILAGAALALRWRAASLSAHEIAAAPQATAATWSGRTGRGDVPATI